MKIIHSFFAPSSAGTKKATLHLASNDSDENPFDITLSGSTAHLLTSTAAAYGSLSGTTPQTVAYGANGTAVTAIPDAAYRFTQWSDGSMDNPRTDMNVTTDRSVTAYFVLTVLSFTSTPTDVTITDCDYQSASGALAIPGTINGLPVISIEGYAFYNCNRLTSITIPASVTSIGTAAFMYCNQLTSMTIPEGVTSIANFLFFNCYQLASITVPASVTSLGAGAFDNCSSLIHITVAGDSYSAGANGRLSGPTPLPGSPGAIGAAVTAVPGANYHFVNWSDSSTANPRTDSNETTDLSVMANFAINMPAVLSAIAPPNGSIGGGTSVTITGTNLLDTTSVTFGGIEATIDSSSPTNLTVTSPEHAAGPVAVVVTTPSGSSNPKIFTYDTPLETWRQTWFGPAATNTGDAANHADPYHTGISNILVFAFLGPNQDPATAKLSQLPQPTIAPATFTYQFTEPVGTSGITYGAQWSATLGDDWQAIPDTGTAPEHIFSVPVDSARKFLRLTVQ